MSKVTNIKDAREMRAIGLPLNCEVIDGGELPKPCADAMEAAFKAAIKFRTRIYAYVDNQNASTAGALVRAYCRFMKASKPPKDDETFPTNITAAMLTSEFAEIREQWSSIIGAMGVTSPLFDALEAGEDVRVDLSHVWPFVPTEATKRRQQTPEL
jgi:hypothetical protein